MTYGFILNTIGVESITVTGEEDKFFEQTFDNLKDARKAAALATAALDSMRGTYQAVNVTATGESYRESAKGLGFTS